jgi:hypothetical protein
MFTTRPAHGISDSPAPLLDRLLLRLRVSLLGSCDDARIDELARHGEIAGFPQLPVEQVEQPPDRTCLRQLFAKRPDRIGIRHRIAQPKAEKADPGESIAQIKLGPFVAQIVLRLQDQHLEHQHMVKGWSPALRAICSRHCRFHFLPEELEVHHRSQTFQVIALLRQAGQPLLDVEETSLTRHIRLLPGRLHHTTGTGQAREVFGGVQLLQTVRLLAQIDGHEFERHASLRQLATYRGREAGGVHSIT